MIVKAVEIKLLTSERDYWDVRKLGSVRLLL